MGNTGRYQDGDYVSKLYGLDGWMSQLVDQGRFATRDAVVDRLVDDYGKRFLKNASPTEQFVVGAVATGLRLYMPESEVVQLVTQGMSPFLPRKWANRKAQKKVHSVLNGLGVCSNIHLFGLDETTRAWGKDAEPQTSPVDVIKDVFSSMVKSAVRSVKPRVRRSYDVGPVTVSAHVRHLKNGRTVQVRFHKRKRTGRR